VAKPKPITDIDFPRDTAQAIRQILFARLKRMCDYRTRALDWSSPRGVHEMRVASRRLRSALKYTAALKRWFEWNTEGFLDNFRARLNNGVIHNDGSPAEKTEDSENALTKALASRVPAKRKRERRNERSTNRL
jgi:hypothetical protein